MNYFNHEVKNAIISYITVQLSLNITNSYYKQILFLQYNIKYKVVKYFKNIPYCITTMIKDNYKPIFIIKLCIYTSFALKLYFQKQIEKSFQSRF